MSFPFLRAPLLEAENEGDHDDEEGHHLDHEVYYFILHVSLLLLVAAVP